MVGMNFSHST